MSSEAVFEKIKKVIVEQLGVDASSVTMSSSFSDDLGADSLDQVELVMAFEECFEVDIPDEEVGKIKTVKDVVDFVEKKKKA